MSGNARGPSTAFCLLYKFFTMKLTEKQIRDTLDHPDSPFIRAVRMFCHSQAAGSFLVVSEIW